MPGSGAGQALRVSEDCFQGEGMMSTRRGAWCLLAAFVLLVAGSNTANAQQVFGNILGTITDPSGGAVTDAKVTITDTNKGTQSVVMSDASGNYAKGQLIPD